MNPNAQRKFTEIKTAMLLHAPFFASIFLDGMEVRIGKFDGIDTAATNGTIIWFDEDFLAKQSLPQAVFVTCHEIAHRILDHLPRARRYLDLGLDGKPFNPGVWNDAGDYIINDMLVMSGLDMPTIGLRRPEYDGTMLCEDVYRDIMSKRPPPRRGGGGGGSKPPPDGSTGVMSNDSADGCRMDVHIYEESNLTAADLKRIVKTAANAAKAMGKMPAGLDRWVDGLLTPKVDWKEKLRNTIIRAASRDSTTWASPHRRRLVTQNIYLPSYTGIGAGIIVDAQDTSGSMGEPALLAGKSELAAIISECRPEKVYVIPCDAAVGTVTELGPDDDLTQTQIPMEGGGGTSFVPVFDWIAENNVEPAVLIYFTDLYGSFPDQAPKYPVIWVTDTEGMEAPFGETIHIKLEDAA